MDIREVLKKRDEIPISKANSERAALIEQFLARLNAERLGTEWKPLTARTIAIKVGHLKTHDLYYLFSICKDSKSFGKTFFGSLKPK